MTIDPILEKIKEQITNKVYPACSLALLRDHQWQECYFGNPSHHKSDRHRAYDLASVSKVVGVGTLCLFWCQSNPSFLNRPLHDFYPDFTNKEVTIKQLLTHTSGIDPFIPHRNQLGASELKEAINQITVTNDKRFHYTDINFILLGFMLEHYYQKDLAQLFSEQIFQPFGMSETCFGPLSDAVPTVRGEKEGIVHDPKARVLGVHTGSAGLFSTLADLEKFVEHYLTDAFAQDLWQSFTSSHTKERSLAWDLQGDWLLHTGYTGTFVMINRKKSLGAIFLANRTYEKDHRQAWIKERDSLMKIMKKTI